MVRNIFSWKKKIDGLSKHQRLGFPESTGDKSLISPSVCRSKQNQWSIITEGQVLCLTTDRYSSLNTA